MAKHPDDLTCVSLVICDDIFRDEATKKMIIVGTFDRITAFSLPAAHAKMSMVFTLTNAHGEYDLSVVIEHEASGQELLRMSGPLRAEDPLQMMDFNITLHQVVFPEAGKYWISLESGGRILQQRPLFVVLQKPPSESDDAGRG